MLAFLQAGAALDSFVTLDHSPHGWISGLAPLTPPQLFKYRTLCRRFMVMADIWKPA